MSRSGFPRRSFPVSDRLLVDTPAPRPSIFLEEQWNVDPSGGNRQMLPRRAEFANYVYVPCYNMSCYGVHHDSKPRLDTHYCRSAWNPCRYCSCSAALRVARSFVLALFVTEFERSLSIPRIPTVEQGCRIQFPVITCSTLLLLEHFRENN